MVNGTAEKCFGIMPCAKPPFLPVYSAEVLPFTLLWRCIWNKNNLLPALFWRAFCWAGLLCLKCRGAERGDRDLSEGEILLQVLHPQANKASWVPAQCQGMLPARRLVSVVCTPVPTAVQRGGMMHAHLVPTSDRETPPPDIKLWSCSNNRTTQHLYVGFFSLSAT